jgi:hypothetical protein
MYSHRKSVRRFSFLLHPAGIVIGYILTLFAIVAGAAAFPSSNVWMAPLFVVVGAFFVVAISVIVVSYLFFICAFFAALMNFGRRFCFGRVRMHASQWSSKLSQRQKDLEYQGTDVGLWDRWIDGSCEVSNRSHNGKEWWSDGSSYF